MLQQLENFYQQKQEPNRSCLLALRSIILEQNSGIAETIKYGMPCFSYKGKACCYLWVDKKTSEPYILMVEGRHLNHPNLESGDRARMKILRVDPGKDLPLKTIQTVIDEAIDLYRKGVVKTR